MSKDKQVDEVDDEVDDDSGYPVHTIAQRFEDFGCEDCDESADLILMFTRRFQFATRMSGKHVDSRFTQALQGMVACLD